MDKRAIITLSIIAISTVIGSLAVTGVALAMENIAKAEANRVMQIEASARGAENEQIIMNTFPHWTQEVQNNLFNANDMMSKVKHLLTIDKTWGLEDP